MQVGGCGCSADQQRTSYDNEINRFHRASLWSLGRFYKPDGPVRQYRLKTNNSSHEKAQIVRPPGIFELTKSGWKFAGLDNINERKPRISRIHTKLRSHDRTYSTTNQTVEIAS
jgi:hypothetical protein